MPGRKTYDKKGKIASAFSRSCATCKGADKGVVASNSVDLNSKRRPNNVYQPLWSILHDFDSLHDSGTAARLVETDVSLSRQFKDRVVQYSLNIEQTKKWKEKNVLWLGHRSFPIYIGCVFVLISRQWPQKPRPFEAAPIIFTQL